MGKTLAYSQVGVVNVDDGKGIQSSIIDYAVSESGTTPPGNIVRDGSGNPILSNDGKPLTDGSWSTTIPTVPDGWYLWTRTRLILSDGSFDMIYNVSYSGEDGAKGETGTSVVNVIPEYRLSDSSASLTGNGAGYAWSTTKPKVESGQYIWERQRNELSDGTVKYSDAVCDITISGVIVDVDQNKKAIAQKVWATDITSSINQYDSSTTQTIRDRVSQTETDIAGITSTVSDVQSTLSTKADGSTVTALQNTVTQNKQTADAFQQTVQSTYAKLTDVDDKIDDIKIGGHNLYIIADEVPGYLHGTNGAIQTQDAINKEVTSFYIPVNDGENYIIQSWVTPNIPGESWLAYQFFSNNSGTPVENRISKYGKEATSNVEITVDGLEHLTYDVKVPTGANYLRVSYRKFDDGYAMVEKATKPSEYAINPKDLEQYADDAVESAKTEIKQTTDSISLEVSRKVGASEVISKINQSPESITIDASKVNLIGAVTFNMLDSAAQSRITSVENTASSANSWITTNGNTVLNAKNIVNNWATDATSATTTIKGGLIQAHTILTEALATNAIMSSNYVSGSSTDVPTGYYSTAGSFLDLATGNFYTPNFSVKDADVYVNGKVNMLSGKIGDVGNSYWQVGTVYGEDWSDKAAIIAHGSALIQTAKLTLGDDKLSSFNGGDYIKEGNEWYDYGLQVPTRSAAATSNKTNFLYMRKIASEPSEDTLDQDWTYLFRVDKDGNIYEGNLKLSDKYASIDGVTGAYLPRTGGTITGNLTVEGTLTAVASKATQLNTSRNLNVNLGLTTNSGKIAFNGTADVTMGVTGTLGVGNGGTGKSSWTQYGIVYATATNALGQMAVGTSGQVLTSKGSAAPAWTNQSALSVGSATKATQDSDGNAINTTYRKLSNTDFTELSTGDLTVTGSATFTNGLSGDLTGTASSVENNLKIQFNGGTTEGTNQFTYNGSAVKNINITKSSVGLSNVENTALSTWAGSANLTTTKVGTLAAAATKGVDTSISASSTSGNLPTSAAVASFVEDKGYVTSSGVTSARVQATSPVVSSQNTAQGTTLNTTISLADGYGDTKNPYGTKTANYVLAGPSSGSAAAPSFRALVASDIPSLTKSKISDFPTTWALTNVTGADDLKAIEGLTGTSGMLKKTAENTWSLVTVVSGFSINNDKIIVTKSDGTSQELTINITGQVVSGATILSDSNGEGLNVGDASHPTYFSNGLPVQGNVIPTLAMNGSATTAASFYAPTGAGTSGQYLKSTGGTPTWETFSKSTIGLGNVANLDQSKAIKSITKSGGTYTATALDGTTSTFSESVTGVKGSEESTYRTGNVSLTAHNVGALAYNDTIFSTNSFASDVYRQFYMSKIDNAFFALDKRYTVTATNDGVAVTNVAQFFDGNYEGNITHIEDGKTAVITINFGTKFVGYPYGYIYVSFYNNCIPSSITARVYNTYESQGIGWHDLTFEKYDRSIFKSEYQAYYGMQILEITIVGSSDTPYGYTSPTEIEFQPTRPEPYAHNPMVTKFGPQTLYYDITAPNFIGNLNGTANRATADASGNTITTTYVKKAGDTMTGKLTVPTMKVNSIINDGPDTQYTHRIDFGGSGFNHMDFYEYGGVYNFYKNTAYPGTDSATLLGKITTNGWEGNVVGNLTGTASKATADGNGLNIAQSYSKLSGAVFTGAVTGTSFGASSYVSVNTGNSGTAGGLALYGTTPTSYGIAMRQTANGGKHGYVQGDWAIYNYMTGATNRGFIWKAAGTTVVSIDGLGNASFNGEVVIGTTGTDIDGSCSLVMDRDLGCLNFVFN